MEPTPLLELAVFLVALLGFTCSSAWSASPPDGPPTGASLPAAVYRLHLASSLVYNGLITCTMALRLRTGIAFALLFTVAMGLHFVLTDRGLQER